MQRKGAGRALLTGGKHYNPKLKKGEMDESETALTESLIIWVSFVCFWLVLHKYISSLEETVEAFFAYLFVGGEGFSETSTISVDKR